MNVFEVQGRGVPASDAVIVATGGLSAAVRRSLTCAGG
jgi:hypothetical protein